MDARRESEPTPMKNRTTVERRSERELVVTRTFNGPARIVFEAWTKPELFRRWWVPKSMGMSLRSCEMDVRVGGKYRLEFEPDAMAFFGTYLEVTPHSRLVWTNEEGGEGGPVTTVTFEEKGGKTLLVLHELYSSKEALDAAGTGAADAMVETFAQLDELLLTLGASVGHEVDLESAAWPFTRREPDEVVASVGVTAAGPGRVDAAATSRSRRRGASFFHYRPNGARRAHRRPTSLQVSRRRRAAARLCWVALASRRGRAPSARRVSRRYNRPSDRPATYAEYGPDDADTTTTSGCPGSIATLRK